ncbi:hypothetical protein LDENG_00048870 [Lucifuga dentata]|nr:hypothetical protein LDENG_00048870 [Lucifuga dentata]
MSLLLQSHIKSITKTAWFRLSNIAKIQPVLSLRDAETVIHAFVSSRLDYCNVLFSGLPNCVTRSLQLVQNAAVRILTKTRKFDYITPILSELLTPYTPAHSLCSLDAALLVIPSVNKKSVGFRACAYRAPYLWNGLPLHVKEVRSVEIFKSRLETHLYSLA